MMKSKLDNRPQKRGPRRDHKTNEIIPRQRTSQHYAVRALKRQCPAGMSMKKHMAKSEIGKAWLQRKREAR